jgi:hypothetical protein
VLGLAPRRRPEVPRGSFGCLTLEQCLDGGEDRADGAAVLEAAREVFHGGHRILVHAALKERAHPRLRPPHHEVAERRLAAVEGKEGKGEHSGETQNVKRRWKKKKQQGGKAQVAGGRAGGRAGWSLLLLLTCSAA